jgi:hypothetical protein
MSTIITAGNATNNGASLLSAADGILEFKTGTGAGTTALSIDASQNATFAGTLTVTGGIAATGTGQIQPITASVAANALTVTLNPTALSFRSPTLTSGTVVTRTIGSAISMTVSSGSTLGTVSAQQSRIVVLAIDNAGTVELAVVNISGGTDLTETGVISTTAEGGAGAADSATVVYSTTARTSVAYRVVGYVESTQATAGTWATAPSTIQGYGGQALSAMSSLGYSQTWQTVTRTSGVTYYNTTGRPIVFCCSVNLTQATTVVVNGVTVFAPGAQPYITGLTTIIPPNASYVATSAQAGLVNPRELR